MQKGRIEFTISFLEPGENSELNGNVQIFVYKNLNCIFSRGVYQILNSYPPPLFDSYLFPKINLL